MRSTRGFTLIEILLALGLAAFMVMVIATTFLSLGQQKKRADFLVAIANLRLNFQQTLLRSQDWAATKAGNSAMACFGGSTPSSCASLAALGAQPLRLFAAANPTTPVYDSGDALSGYRLDGTPCSSYGQTTDCVLKPVLTWQVQCNLAQDASCQSPLIVVDLDYAYRGVDLGSLNLKNYAFSINIPTFPLVPSAVCAGVAPSCPSLQAAICESGGWACQEFGP